MYVKMLQGHQAGNIVDLRNDIALQFLSDGRADHAFRDPSPEVPIVQTVAQPQAPKAAKRSRDRRRV